LVGKPEGKGTVGRPGRRWEDNIRMNFREIWWEILYYVHVAQDRDQWRYVMNAVIKFQVP
jgi:hypothetical protein